MSNKRSASSAGEGPPPSKASPPVAAPTAAAPVPPHHHLITEEELNACDREPLHLLGNIQGGAGHVIFLTRTAGVAEDSKKYSIVAVDKEILSVKWISPPAPSSSPLQQDDDENDDKKKSADPHLLLGKSVEDCLTSSPVFVERNEDEDDHQNDAKTKDPTSTTLMELILNSIDEMQEADLSRTFFFVRVPPHDNKKSSPAAAAPLTSEAAAAESNATSWGVSISAISTIDKTSKNPILCMEIEPLPPAQRVQESGEEDNNNDYTSALVHLGRIMGSTEELEKLCASACNHMFELFRSAYHRGMVYVFKDDLSGEVVHEIKCDHVTTSYKGLRFPASDIPKPARELFLKNGLRYNYDIEAVDNPILSVTPEQIDLTQCRMRAIHKPHIIYLRNMGVVSSLAAAVVVQGRLWGLLTFHRYGKTPFKPNLYQRIACETIASMLSARIERQYVQAATKRSFELNQVLQKWDKQNSIVQNMREAGKTILEVCDADCLVAQVDDDSQGEQLVLGNASLCPSQAFWKHLGKQSTTDLQVCDTRAAVIQMGLTPEDCPAAGFCYFRSGNTHVFLGRALRSADVVWAGKPDLPKLRIGGILNPRASFDQFMEKARNETRKWSRGDLLVVGILRLHISNARTAA